MVFAYVSPSSHSRILHALTFTWLGCTLAEWLDVVSGVLGVPNGSTMTPGEGRNRKLNSELANGRLVTRLMWHFGKRQGEGFNESH